MLSIQLSWFYPTSGTGPLSYRYSACGRGKLQPLALLSSMLCLTSSSALFLVLYTSGSNQFPTLFNFWLYSVSDSDKTKFLLSFLLYSAYGFVQLLVLFSFLFLPFSRSALGFA